MARRKAYQSDHYEFLTNQLTDMINNLPQIQLPPIGWNIQGELPTDSQLRFFSGEFGNLFSQWDEFDCRTIKLINPHKPACRLSFFKTHRYFLKKAIDITHNDKLDTIQLVLQRLQEQLDNLSMQLPLDTATVMKNQTRIKTLQSQLANWLQIAKQPDQFQIALSNYHQFYYYNTLSFKYLIHDKESDLKLANETVHLLKNQYEKARGDYRAVTQTRYNIIFIDLDAIDQPDPYQYKMIHLYLDTFPLQTEMIKYHVYARQIDPNEPSDSSN